MTFLAGCICARLQQARVTLLSARACRRLCLCEHFYLDGKKRKPCLYNWNYNWLRTFVHAPNRCVEYYFLFGLSFVAVVLYFMRMGKNANYSCVVYDYFWLCAFASNTHRFPKFSPQLVVQLQSRILHGHKASTPVLIGNLDRIKTGPSKQD